MGLLQTLEVPTWRYWGNLFTRLPKGTPYYLAAWSGWGQWRWEVKWLARCICYSWPQDLEKWGQGWRKEGDSPCLDTHFVPTLCFVPIRFHANAHNNTIYWWGNWYWNPMVFLWDLTVRVSDLEPGLSPPQQHFVRCLVHSRSLVRLYSPCG